jgi:large subunit ribosomal protein L25
MDKQILNAEVRKISGRKVKILRNKGLLPANVFGKKIKSEAIQVDLKEFEKLFAKVGETGLVTLNIQNGKKEEKSVLVSNIQMNPLTDKPIHVDFRQVDLTEKITAEVPVEMVGESPAEKQSIGTVVQYLDEIEVEALPTDLPEKFTIDVSSLVEVDQAVFAKDLKIDQSKVTLKINPDEILVKVEPPQKEEVAPAPAPAEGEVPAEGVAPVEGQAAEGEVPAEGVAPVEEPKKE